MVTDVDCSAPLGSPGFGSWSLDLAGVSDRTLIAPSPRIRTVCVRVIDLDFPVIL